MLRELHIVNLAVIAEARVELVAGLNCVTGATGSGKSFIINAVNVVLGVRGASDLLRKGCDEGFVTAAFDVKPTLLAKVREASDLPLLDAEDEGLIVTRRLFTGGRTRASVNGTPATLQQVRAIGELLVDVHGQHDTAYLLKSHNQLDVLDGFADLDADGGPRHIYKSAWDDLTRARRRLADFSRDAASRRQALELAEFHLAELEAASLDPGEFETLQARASVLENLEDLRVGTAAAYQELYDDDAAVVDRVKAMTRQLDALAAADAALLPIAEGVRNGAIVLEEAARDLGRYADRLDGDPRELEGVNARLTTLHRVLHKYGGTMETALARLAQARADVERLTTQGEDLASCEAQVGPLERRVADAAEILSRQRRDAAARLGPTIDAQLHELGMAKARFTVEVSRADDFGPNGRDVVEFVTQLNPGLDPMPLRRVASGGELSRIMLAVKQVLAREDRISVLVFDEIDANVGGRLAGVVGTKLRRLADRQQVLCITHLPQIASYADRHLVVEKHQADDTRTTVRAAHGDDRLEELAGMIGGKTITDTTRAQARELLDAAADEFRDTPAVKPRVVTPKPPAQPRRRRAT